MDEKEDDVRRLKLKKSKLIAANGDSLTKNEKIPSSKKLKKVKQPKIKRYFNKRMKLAGEACSSETRDVSGERGMSTNDEGFIKLESKSKIVKKKKIKKPKIKRLNEPTDLTEAGCPDESHGMSSEEIIEEKTEELIKHESRSPKFTKKKKISSKFAQKSQKLNEESQLKLNQLKKQCKLDGLNSKKISLIVKKWKAREKRRLARVEERKNLKTCFNCRQQGHTVSECPQTNEDQNYSVGICFKCGSTEHSVTLCKLKTSGFPYAKCFVCNKIGHLSRDCEENPNGAYPEGGSCKRCGKSDHLIKNCPEWSKDNKSFLAKESDDDQVQLKRNVNDDKNRTNSLSVKKTSAKIVKI